MKAQTKDPKGGLTVAGRKEFARKEGAHLRPGVKKPTSDMTPQEMKRKGSWAVRFYGREKLPPLQKNGKPTRFALSAAAWGETVPTTEAAARKIARKVANCWSVTNKQKARNVGAQRTSLSQTALRKDPHSSGWR